MILLVVLYGPETWSLTLRVEQKLNFLCCTMPLRLCTWKYV